MIDKFRLSWALFKASVQVVLTHRKLLLFPIVNGCLMVLIAVFFISAVVAPIALANTGHKITEKAHWQALLNKYAPPTPAQRNQPDENAREALQKLATGAPPQTSSTPASTRANAPSHLASAITLLVYLASMFLATFFNVAFYSEIMAAFDGRGVSISRGIGAAFSRVGTIFMWSLLAGLVGWLIRRVEERLPLVGQIFAGLIGLAWSVAAVFAIPVIVTQPEANPLRVLQSSARTLKQTWGEGLIGYVGFSAANFLVLVTSIVSGAMLGVAAYFLHSGILVIAVVVLWLLGIIAFNYVSGVAQHVFRCALYKYATEGTAPAPFNAEWMDTAWKVKGS